MLPGKGKSKLFDAYYFAHDCGRPYQRDESWLQFFDSIAERIVNDICPRTVLDAGCAMGFLVEMLRKRGVEAYGIDISEYAIENVHEDIRPFCRVASVVEPLDQDYDLIVCIEVLEHLTAREAEKAISQFCKHGRSVLFSSTPYDYKEITHVNVQPTEYWVELFARHDFFRNVDYDATHITPWTILFRQSQDTFPHIIRSYERRLWELLKSNTDLRSLSLEIRNQLVDKENELSQLTAQLHDLRDSLDHVQKNEEEKVERIREAFAGELEEIRFRYEDEISKLRVEIEEKERAVRTIFGRLEEDRETILSLTKENEIKDQNIWLLQDRVTESERTIQKLRTESESREHYLRTWQQQTEESIKVNDQLRLQVRQWEEHWDDLEQGAGWRIIKYLRAFRLKIIPKESRRERIFYWLLGGLRGKPQGGSTTVSNSRGRIDFNAGVEEEVKRMPMQFSAPSKVFPFDIKEIEAPSPIKLHETDVDIIICVHNALEDIKRCLESIVRRTMPPYRLILVDDGSDPPTVEYLLSFSQSQNAILICNDQAHGYTRAANQGLKHATAQHIVLLNSDTVVTEYWLDRMISCAESSPNIGMVGPLSNTASWQSIPEVFRQDGDWASNELSADLSIDRIAEFVAEFSGKVYPRIPFLNGFCLLLKRDLLGQIGYLDEEQFGEGYGEENDYCLRAQNAGWELALADDVYIFHAQSRSYSHEKRRRLTEKSNRILALKHGQGVISEGALICREDRVIQGIRARSKVMHLRKEMISRGLEQWEGLRVGFLLPIIEPGGGGHVVIQEGQAMRKMGVDVRLINLHRNRDAFQGSHPENDLPVIYVNSLSHAKGLISKFDAVVATVYNTVACLEPLFPETPPFIRGYYVQDFEPEFFDKESLAYEDAIRSYKLFPDLIRLTKTEWTRLKVLQETGVDCEVIGPSIDIDLFRPRRRKDLDWPNRPLRICAMIRPSTKRRQAGLTLDILSEIYRRHGVNIEIILFGCQMDDPELMHVKPDFPWKHAGILNRKQLAYLFNELDIFVDFSLFQAMGLNAMAAMACGVSVIVPLEGGSDCFASHEDNTLFVDSNSREACIDGLERLILGADLRHHLQQQSIHAICKYPPELAAYRFLSTLFSGSESGVGVG